jgi:hypothetical protein
MHSLIHSAGREGKKSFRQQLLSNGFNRFSEIRLLKTQGAAKLAPNLKKVL